MPKVEFTTTGHSHLVGNFSAGDTFTGDAAACEHFVDDACCAKYVGVAAAGAASQAPAQQADETLQRQINFFRAQLDEAIAQLPGGSTDADYVVSAMRGHFGEIFTDADEAEVRGRVKAIEVPPEVPVSPQPEVLPEVAPPAPAPAPAAKKKTS